LYLLATEYVAAERSKGEVLIFHRNFRQNLQRHTDIEAKPCQNKPVNKSFGTCQSGLEGHKEEANQLRKEYSKPTLSWYKLGYQIDSKSSKTVILDDVEGWVKPGTLTALMVGFRESQ
jgi:ATP-binding cassette subfamily G (WHITE) protein 2 (PDR)